MLPSFLVVGAGRSGTTSLHHYLRQHPEIYIPGVKSPSHFYCHGLPPSGDDDHNRVTHDYFVPDPTNYESLFDGVDGEKAIGEVSPAYLASMRAIRKIADTLPKAKIVIILRNPVERFYSRYVGRHRDGLEPLDTVEALLNEERKQPLVRDEAVGTYLSAGFCSHFIEAYQTRFPAGQLLLTFFDDLKADGPAYMQQLFEFLEVSPAFKPDMSNRLNKSGGTIRNPLLRAIWTKSAMARVTVRPYLPRGLRDSFFRRITREVVAQPLNRSIHVELVEIYRHEIEKLQMLTGRDLTHWMQQSS